MFALSFQLPACDLDYAICTFQGRLGTQLPPSFVDSIKIMQLAFQFSPRDIQRMLEIRQIFYESLSNRIEAAIFVFTFGLKQKYESLFQEIAAKRNPQNSFNKLCEILLEIKNNGGSKEILQLLIISIIAHYGLDKPETWSSENPLFTVMPSNEINMYPYKRPNRWDFFDKFKYMKD
jgi:hypothetical protein